MSVVVTMALAFTASFFYIGATLFLKQWSNLSPAVAIFGIMICLGLACLSEMMVLQRARFAEVVILIITLEVGLAVVLSRLAFGESFGLRDLCGMAFLVIGAGLLLWQPTDVAATPPVDSLGPSKGFTRVV